MIGKVKLLGTWITIPGLWKQIEIARQKDIKNRSFDCIGTKEYDYIIIRYQWRNEKDRGTKNIPDTTIIIVPASIINASRDPNSGEMLGNWVNVHSHSNTAEILLEVNRSEVCPFLARIYYAINNSNTYEKEADLPKDR